MDREESKERKDKRITAVSKLSFEQQYRKWLLNAMRLPLLC